MSHSCPLPCFFCSLSISLSLSLVNVFFSPSILLFVLCQAGFGSQNVAVTHSMKRDLAGSDKQGLAPNILPFFFWGGHSRFWQAGLGSQKSAVLFYTAWEDNCLGRICQAGLGSQNSADRFFCLHGMGSQSTAGLWGGVCLLRTGFLSSQTAGFVKKQFFQILSTFWKNGA